MQSSCNLAISASIADPLKPFQEQIAFCEALQSTICVSEKHVTKTKIKINKSQWHLKPEKEALNESGKFTRTLLKSLSSFSLYGRESYQYIVLN